jgi:hypothetical protein
MGSKSIWQNANETVKRKIREHDYQIHRDVKKELDKIYSRAMRDRQLEDSFNPF